MERVVDHRCFREILPDTFGVCRAHIAADTPYVGRGTTMIDEPPAEVPQCGIVAVDVGIHYAPPRDPDL